MSQPQALARNRMWAAWYELYKDNLIPLSGAGAPTDGTSGTGANVEGQGGTGGEYTDTITGVKYANMGTHASPLWSAAGLQTT